MTQTAGEKSYTCSYGGYLVASNRLVGYHII